MEREYCETRNQTIAGDTIETVDEVPPLFNGVASGAFRYRP
jgi:hypothetical protein